MDIATCLKYLLSQNTQINNRIHKFESWQRQMESSGYTSEYLTQMSESLKTGRKILKIEKALKNISIKQWKGSLFYKDINPDHMFFGLSECSGVNKGIFDVKRFSTPTCSLNFEGFAKYWIISNNFDNLLCYDSHETKVFVTKSVNNLTVCVNGKEYKCNILDNFPILNNGKLDDVNYDALLRITQFMDEVVIELINFNFSLSNNKLVMCLEEIVAFKGNSLYFNVKSNLIFNTMDGYMRVHNYTQREYFCYAIAMINLQKIKNYIANKEIANINELQSTPIQHIHQLVLNSLTNISNLETETARVRCLSIELSYIKPISLSISSTKVRLNDYTHDLFNHEFKTQFVGWNYKYGECDRILEPIVFDVNVKLNNESSYLNSSKLSFFQINDFGNPDRLFVLNVKDDLGNEYKLVGEVMFELANYNFHYQGLKVVNPDCTRLEDCYLYGLGENTLWIPDTKFHVNSIVSNIYGSLSYTVIAECQLICKFKVLSERIEYLGSISPSFSVCLEHNNSKYDLKGVLHLSEEFDGIHTKKFLLSNSFVLENKCVALFQFKVADGKLSSSLATHNNKIWPGVRSRDFENDAYQHRYQHTIHYLNYSDEYKELNNHSSVLYDANLNYNFVEAEGCFSGSKQSDHYWNYPTYSFSMFYDERPYVKLFNKAMFNIPVNMSGGAHRVLGKHHVCLLNFDHYVSDYDIVPKQPVNLFLPYPNWCDLLSLFDDEGLKISSDYKITSFTVTPFNAFMLPKDLNSTMDVVGKLITFNTELALIVQTNSHMSVMINDLDKRIKSLEKVCDHLNQQFNSKKNEASSMTQFLSDVCVFIGEMTIMQFPILGGGLILAGIMLEGVSKILKEDLFDGITEIMIGSLLLFLGKRKTKYALLEEMGCGRQRADSNVYLSEMSASIGRRRSYTSYHHYETIDHISPDLSIQQRIFNQIRAHNPSVFDLYHNSGIMLELQSKIKPNYSQLQSNYSRMKRSLGSVISDNGIANKFSDKNSNTLQLEAVIYKTFDYFPLLVEDDRTLIIKVSLKVRLTIETRIFVLEEYSIQIFDDSKSVSFVELNSESYIALSERYVNDFKFEFLTFTNYLLVTCLMSKFSSDDNRLTESYDKLYDSLYLYSGNSENYGHSFDANNSSSTIFKITHMSAFPDLNRDEQVMNIFRRIEHYPNNLVF
jgi:hypothetical protein